MDTARHYYYYFFIMEHEVNGFKQMPLILKYAIEKLGLSISNEEVKRTLFSTIPWKAPTLIDLQQYFS